MNSLFLSIAVFQDQRKANCIRRRIRPRQLGRNVVAVRGEVLRNFVALSNALEIRRKAIPTSIISRAMLGAVMVLGQGEHAEWGAATDFHALRGLRLKTIISEGDYI